MAAKSGAKLSVLLQAVDKFTAPLQKLNSRLNAITAPVQKARGQLWQLGQNSGLSTVVDKAAGVTRAIGGIGTAAVTAARRVAGIGLAAGGLTWLFKRQFVDVAANFEQLQFRLEAIEGGADQAKHALGFITNLSLKSPFNVDAIADSFTRLRINGIDPTNGSLQAMVDQVAKVGGTSEMLNGVSTAFSQMLSKGTLSAEEMNQLAERQIPAWQLLQRTIERVHGRKIEIPQLRKMAEGGSFGTSIMQEMIAQMGIDAAGSAASMSRTWGAMLTRLGTQWDLFKKRVMDGGPFQKLTGHLAKLLDTVDVMAKDGRLQAWADWLGERFLQAFEWLERGFAWLKTDGPRVFEDLKAKGKSLFAVANQVAAALGGWKNAGLLALGAYLAGPLLGAVGTLVMAFGGLAVAIGLTPVGWLLAGIAGLATGAFLVMKHWRSVGPFFQGLFGGIADMALGLIETVRGLVSLLPGGPKADFGRIGAGLKQFAGGAWGTTKTSVTGLGGATSWAAGGIADFLTAPRQTDGTQPQRVQAGGASFLKSINSIGSAPAAGAATTSRSILPAGPIGPGGPALVTRDMASGASLANPVHEFMAAVREFRQARVKVEVTGPRGTRATTQSGPVDLGTRVNMGLTMAEAH